MKREDIIRMAREAWLSDYGVSIFSSGEDVEVALEDIERFAALVAAAEREECIKAVEKSRVIEFVVYPKDYMISRNDVPRCYDFQHARSMEAIRARGNT